MKTEIAIITILYILSLMKCLRVENLGRYRDDCMSADTANKWRGIAAVFILIHHISKEVVKDGVLSILNYIAFPMVAVFLFYSGYGLVKGVVTKGNYLKKFWLKRIRKVMIPYYVVASVALCMEIVVLKKNTHGVITYK